MNDKKFGKSNKMQVQKLPTGIEGFDDVCRGGLPVSRSTLVSGTSGTGKTVFSLQYLHHGICNFDEPGIFVTFEESPLDIIRNAASFGWDLQELIDQNKLLFWMLLLTLMVRTLRVTLTCLVLLRELVMQSENIKLKELQ